MKTLLETFVQYAQGYESAIAVGDHRKANNNHSKLMRLSKLADTTDFYNTCNTLMSHDDDTVKAWAASFYLKKDSQKALSILEEIKKSNKIIGLTAKTLIDMWHKGMIK